MQAFLQGRAIRPAGDYRSFLFTLGVIWFERNGMIILDCRADAANSQRVLYLKKRMDAGRFAKMNPAPHGQADNAQRPSENTFQTASRLGGGLEV
ncbi:hypothetical protein [Kingella potus]|nr:hypothetical protein [Kingella potus]